jgi:hypothetical protein
MFFRTRFPLTRSSLAIAQCRPEPRTRHRHRATTPRAPVSSALSNREQRRTPLQPACQLAAVQTQHPSIQPRTAIPTFATRRERCAKQNSMLEMRQRTGDYCYTGRHRSAAPGQGRPSPLFAAAPQAGSLGSRRASYLSRTVLPGRLRMCALPSTRHSLPWMRQRAKTFCASESFTPGDTIS